MKKFISNKYILYIFGIVLFILVWFIVSLFVKDNVMIFPTPFQTIKEMFVILGNSYVYKALGSSLLRMFIGFGLSLILALILGTLSGCNKYIKELLKPSITVLKAVPTACLLFLFLVVLGAKNAPIVIVTLISFPILYESVVGGYENIDITLLESLKLEGENRVGNIFKIKLPLAMPYIFVGIASSFGLAFKIQIMAEILTGDTRSGLGCAILAAQRNDPTNMVPIFAYSLIAIILVLLIDLLSNVIKKHLNSK